MGMERYAGGVLTVYSYHTPGIRRFLVFAKAS